jgi:hypothetical protein
MVLSLFIYNFSDFRGVRNQAKIYANRFEVNTYHNKKLIPAKNIFIINRVF